MSTRYIELDDRAMEIYLTSTHTPEFLAESTHVSTLLALLKHAEDNLIIAREVAAFTGEYRPVITAAAIRNARARALE